MAVINASWHRSTASGVLGLCVALTPLATRADDTPASWLLSASGDVGQDDSHGLAASVDYASSGEQFTFALAGQRSTAPAFAADTRTLDSTSGQAAIGGRLGAVHVELGFDTTRDEALRRSGQLSAAIAIESGGWNARAGLSRRHTRFDGFPVQATILLRNGQTFELSGVVGCEVDDLGYDVTISYGAGDWDIYGGGRWANFDDFGCSYTSNVPLELRRIGTERFNQFAAERMALLTQRIGGRIGQESQLLDSLYGVGLARHFDALSVAFDYTHSTAAFDQTVQDGYALTGSWSISARSTAGLTLGTTVREGDSSAYAGVHFSWRL